MRETRSEKPMGFCSSQPPLSFWKAVACSTALKGALQRQSHHARILHEVRHLCLFDCSLQVSAAIVKEFVPIWSGSFCRDSTPNGRDRPPSRDRQFMDFFHGRQSPICPNHKLCGIPQLRIVSRVHARRLYAGIFQRFVRKLTATAQLTVLGKVIATHSDGSL